MLEDNLSFRILAGVTYTTEEIKMTIKAKTGSSVDPQNQLPYGKLECCIIPIK